MTTAERKSLNAERQQQAEAWMKLKLEIDAEKEVIKAAEIRRDNLKSSLERAAKDLRGAVGSNQREKIYDVRKACDTDKLVRVKYTYRPTKAGLTDPSKNTELQPQIDTIEIEDRE